jgi:hypothetical protein
MPRAHRCNSPAHMHSPRSVRAGRSTISSLPGEQASRNAPQAERNLASIMMSSVSMVPRNGRAVLALAIISLEAMPSVAHAGEPILPAGWVARPIPATRDREWTCANWSEDEWLVSAAAGHLEITRAPSVRRVVALPFEPLLAPDEDSMRRPTVVHAVPGGYLVGYDRGEFGGGLFWFSADGRKHARLAPPAAARAKWFPENVHAIAAHDGTYFVFQGVSHLSLRLGRVLKVRPSRNRWVVAVLVALDATPEVVLEERSGNWLVASTDGVSRVMAGGKVERLWGTTDVLASVYPGSIARTSDGNVYVGMRSWVLRLTRPPAGARWQADLLAPVFCVRFLPAAGDRCPCDSSETHK